MYCLYTFSLIQSNVFLTRSLSEQREVYADLRVELTSRRKKREEYVSFHHMVLLISETMILIINII